MSDRPGIIRLGDKVRKDTIDRLEYRFHSKVRVTETGCWEWTARRFPTGYGQFTIGRLPEKYAHRWSYRLYRGEIPEGLEIDHLCRNRCCVNPAHLEAVTHQVNSERGECGEKTGAMHRSKTHCRNGHAFDEANTRIDREGYRACRACARAYYHRNKGNRNG